eukprot:SAG31_NODE_10874_length_1088_cov_1.830131_1_plen_169_part_00
MQLWIHAGRPARWPHGLCPSHYQAASTHSGAGSATATASTEDSEEALAEARAARAAATRALLPSRWMPIERSNRLRGDLRDSEALCKAARPTDAPEHEECRFLNKGLGRTMGTPACSHCQVRVGPRVTSANRATATPIHRGDTHDLAPGVWVTDQVIQSSLSQIRDIR